MMLAYSCKKVSFAILMRTNAKLHWHYMCYTITQGNASSNWIVNGYWFTTPGEIKTAFLSVVGLGFLSLLQETRKNLQIICGNGQNKAHHSHLNYVCTTQEYLVIDMMKVKGQMLKGFLSQSWQALTTANANTKQCSKSTLRDFLIPFSMY